MLKAENTFGLEKGFELSWSEDAKKRLNKVPSFGKGMVIKRVEQYARENGYSEITPDIMKEAKEKMAVDKKMMFPFLNMFGKKNMLGKKKAKKKATNGKIEWKTEALERVKNAPDFVRPGIYKLMEKRAKERGYKTITSEFLSEIRDESMRFASKRINKLGLEALKMEAFDMAKARLKSEKKKDVIDNIKGFLNDRTEKNTEIITKFKKYLSQEVNTSNDS